MSKLVISKQVWDAVRKKYNYPPLSEPQVIPDMEGGAGFDFASNKIVVGEKIVRELHSKTGITEEEALDAILSHEVGHYMVFPRSLGTIILASKMVDDFFKEAGEDFQSAVLQLYADMANDTEAVLHETKRDAILSVRSAMQRLIEDPLNKDIREVMLAYLYYQAGKPYTLSKELQPFLEKMKEIDFLKDDHESMRLGLYNFGCIIKDIMKKNNVEPVKFTLCIIEAGDVDAKQILKRMSGKDLEKALREIALKVTKGEYDKIKEFLKGKGIVVDTESGKKSIGTSEGRLQIDWATVEYYKSLSMQYPIVISRRPMRTKKFVRSWDQIEKWRVGSEPLLTLPSSSDGKLLPGITKKIRIHPHPIRSMDYRIPHALIVIDSSGSMPDPACRKSYAVLAAVCAARSYHLQGSSVGVINFSGRSFYLPYSRELDDILGAICAYQGGGTIVDIKMLEKMLGRERLELYKRSPGKMIIPDHGELPSYIPREAIKKGLNINMSQIEEAFCGEAIDLIMFTDGGIYNLQEVINFFAKRKEMNRATIVLAEGFDQELKSKDDRVRIIRVKDAKDIPLITMREVQDSIDNYLANINSE